MKKMEPITLCGAVIVMFGLWVEFEPKIMAVVNAIRNSRLFSDTISQTAVHRPVYMKKMPICFAKTSGMCE